MGTPPEIESTVRERRRIKAHALIRSYLRTRTGDWDAAIQASEWLRRLGDGRAALRVLKLPRLIRTAKDTSSPEGRALLQAAYVLNFIGANSFALALSRDFICRRPEEHRLLAQIHQDHFENEAALLHFEKALSGPADFSYSGRLTRLNYADTCAAVGRYEQARETARAVTDITTEPLLKGICLQAHGEYYAREKRFTEAHALFEEAVPYFPAGEGTADSAILWKWQGYILGELGRRTQARQLMSRSEAIMRKRQLRPEAWVDLIRLKRRLGMVSEREWQQAIHYPGLAPGLLRELSLEEPTPPPPDDFSTGGARAPWLIQLNRNEFHHRGRRSWGIPKELECLALIGLAGKHGIGIVKLLSLLWPEEPHSFEQLEGRLNSVLFRLRHHFGFTIESEGRQLKLSRDAISQVRIVTGPPCLPSLLERTPTFSRREFESHYGLSSTQAKAVLADWIQKTWIGRTGTASQIRYLRYN